MLIKTNKTWIDPTTVRAIRPLNSESNTVHVYFKNFGDMMEISGISVDALAEKVNDALANPFFEEGER